MPVRKANKVLKKPLKVLIIGGPGVGKTHFAIDAPGKTLIYDSDNGSDLFEGRIGFEDKFDVWEDKDGRKTSSIRELEKCIDYLMTPEGAKEYTNFAIDFIGDIWDKLQEEKMDWKISKRKTAIDNESVLEQMNPKDWADLKRIFKNLMLKVRQLPQNVFLIAKEKEIQKKNSEGAFEGTGEYTFDSEKNTMFAVDFTLRIIYDDKKKRRYGIIMKDRSGNYEKGAEIDNPTFSLFRTIVDSMRNGEEYKSMNPTDRENIFDTGDSLEDILQEIILLSRELTIINPKIVEGIMQRHLQGKGISSIRTMIQANALRDELALIPKDSFEPLNQELVDKLLGMAKEAGITSMEGILATRTLPDNPPVFITDDVIREKLIPRVQVKLDSVKGSKK